MKNIIKSLFWFIFLIMIFCYMMIIITATSIIEILIGLIILSVMTYITLGFENIFWFLD